MSSVMSRRRTDRVRTYVEPELVGTRLKPKPHAVAVLREYVEPELKSPGAVPGGPRVEGHTPASAAPDVPAPTAPPPPPSAPSAPAYVVAHEDTASPPPPPPAYEEAVRDRPPASKSDTWDMWDLLYVVMGVVLLYGLWTIFGAVHAFLFPPPFTDGICNLRWRCNFPRDERVNVRETRVEGEMLPADAFDVKVEARFVDVVEIVFVTETR